MGRPTKLTPEAHERIVKAISTGATYELAAQHGGVVYHTFNNWMQRGEAELERRESPYVKEDTIQWQNEQPFVEFFQAIKKAEGNAAVGWLEKIEKAANEGNWQAAAWKLERRYPRDYGRNVTEHTGKDGNELTIKVVYGNDDANS